MKVTLRGTITRIGEPSTAGSSQVRELVINRKYHNPDTGEIQNEDWFPVQCWDDVFKRDIKTEMLGSKIEMQGFVNGRRAEKNGEASYFCNIVAKSIKPI